MKITTIMVCLLTLCADRLSAQNCDIAQTGLAIFNAANTAPIATVPAGQNANFKFSIANFGTDPGCTIPANSATAILDFTPTNGCPYMYDGPASFVSGFFTWTYNSNTKILTGTNTTAIPNGNGDANILVKVIGITPGTGISHLTLSQGMGVPDNSGNNVSGAQLIISAAAVSNTNICPGSHASFVAPTQSGNTYQWQLDTGSGFNDISDNANYSGTTTAFLSLADAPTSWYGYKYQCRIVNGANTIYTTPLILKFSIVWLGNTNDDWHTASNWGCSGLPDSNTDVIINTGSSRYPKVNFNASCRSVNLQPGAAIEIKPGIRLDVSGQ